MPENKKINIKKKTKSKVIKKNTVKNTVSKLRISKINYYIEIVENTIIYVQKYKIFDILNASQLNDVIQKLLDINASLMCILDYTNTNKNFKNKEEILDKLQVINNELSFIFRSYGTKNIVDILNVVFGSSYVENNSFEPSRFSLIKKFIHPISYKILEWKPNSKNDKTKNTRIARNKIVEDFMIVDTAKTLDCFDMARTSNTFQIKVSGLKICFQNYAIGKTLIISGISDEIILQCCSESFIYDQLKVINSSKPKDSNFFSKDFDRYSNSLTLKELLIYNELEIYHKYNGFCAHNNQIKQKTIHDNVKDFLSSELYDQRRILIQLLIKADDPEFQYLAYLLYDLLSSENDTNNIDTQEQTILFDSLPWNIKKYFKNAMKNTINYTNSFLDFETSKIPLEQQICLMKASRTVKEKAMIKLKEVKAKSEDSGSKARHWLEGLLKIPFGYYKKEKILDTIDDYTIVLNDIISYIKKNDKDKIFKFEPKNKYTFVEINNILKIINDFIDNYNNNFIKNVVNKSLNNKRTQLVNIICHINSGIKLFNLNYSRIKHSGKKNVFIKEQISKFIIHFKDNDIVFEYIYKIFDFSKINIEKINQDISIITEQKEKISNYMSEVSNILNEAVHGHSSAKRHIERIIGQWISGEQDGYCLGFEGAPGVGKTSFARKGLSLCLKDTNGEPRPLAFIAMGGASNGSTLAGHNYTYVGSTWGKIADILMDTKCMNPIIFIDELDKISKTENGKEIVGILTHLIDRTQNEQFQDKYFNGVDLDLSKALFIFSYNDVSCLDRILLDRIHRVKFDHLTLDDKLEICNKYILPEFYKKFNIKDMNFSDEILIFIIETYTNESGVRKLKEILFEIISEINLEILKNDITTIPVIDKDIVVNKFLKEKIRIRIKTVHDKPETGLINGLWANSLGMGGIIPIECNFFPSNNFLDFKLTGLQGDVMKESMNAAIYQQCQKI
ncbi:MAG: hypothetical protein CXT73_04875 [Methanobacteriota archaeon]|nr:MAG: hypothetical protein CXT73_04875 [Euryarchaeota archaeon]